MPLFLSFFFGLRGMTDLPVESLRNGGLWWFHDLTVCDPYYILPVATCVTMMVTIEVRLIKLLKVTLCLLFLKLQNML